MNYPLISEYIEAIKSAQDNFEKLSHLRPVLCADGAPVMSSGNFAVVFKMTDGKKDYAIKCFTREQEGRAEAYRRISEELENVESAFLCPIRYFDKELFVDAANNSETEFPVLQMDWVDGVTLENYVRDNLHDKNALENLAYNFCRMAQWLLTQPFAHGDLKPDNILVRANGSLVLVDYDGIFVPAMKGSRARELGSPNYRHPLRTEEQFDEHIDDFALASIALSLKAIAMKPELYSESGSADRILFSETDFRNLGESKTVAALQPLMDDPEFLRLYGLFLLAHSDQTLANVSFCLFKIAKPTKPAPEEVLSTKVTNEDLADAWEDEYGVKYSKDGKRLLYANRNLTEYTIRKGTKVICDDAFFNYTFLQRVTIPASVTSIGGGVFSGCNLQIESNSQQFFSDGICLIDRSSHHLICCHRNGIEEYSIPSTVTSIGKEAFKSCYSLKSVTIPASVTSIGKGTFWHCISLQSVTISNSVTSIGESAFSCCSSLQSINIPTSVTRIGYWAFYSCSSLRSITIPESVTSIGESAFSLCESLRSVTIPASVTSIGQRTFCGCSSLQSVTIPASVTRIGDYAFSGCSSLQSVTIPESVTSIGYDAFCGCSSLRSITIPESVTSIGYDAFWGCSSLLSITIPASVTSIGQRTFCGCSSLQSVTIPASVTRIGDYAFSVCSSLRTIEIPASVTSIGMDAFNRCHYLKQIFIPRNSREKFEKLLPIKFKDNLVETDI